MSKIGEAAPKTDQYFSSLLNCTTWKGRVIAIVLIAATVSLLIVSPLFRVAFNVTGVAALIFALFRECGKKDVKESGYPTITEAKCPVATPKERSVCENQAQVDLESGYPTITEAKCPVAIPKERSVCENQTQVDLISALEMQAYVALFFASYPQDPTGWMDFGRQVATTGNIEVLAAEFEKVLDSDFIHLDNNFYTPWYFWSQEIITSFLDLLKANPRLKASAVKIFCTPPELMCIWSDKENWFSLVCRNSNKGVVKAVLQAMQEEPVWKRTFLDNLQQEHEEFPRVADWIYSEGKIDEVIEFLKENGFDAKRADRLNPLKAKEQSAQFSGMRDLKIEIGSIKRRRHSRQRVSLGHELLEQNLKEEKKQLTNIFLEIFG